MDFSAFIETVKDFVPVPVLMGVIAVIMLVYGSLFAASAVEAAVEEKRGKQIKIFDHKKIFLSAFWCIVVAVALAVAGYIEWKQILYYWLLILGASTFTYEAFLKKTGIEEKKAE